jgi:hypothetical protein
MRNKQITQPSATDIYQDINNLHNFKSGAVTKSVLNIPTGQHESHRTMKLPQHHGNYLTSSDNKQSCNEAELTAGN